MIRRMEPRALLKQLMKRDGLNPTSLSDRLNNATTQPQIHKFLGGKAKEPRRSTLAPVAAYFRIPLDALYDADAADSAAEQKQLIGTEKTSNQPLAPAESTQPAINNAAPDMSPAVALLAKWLEGITDADAKEAAIQSCMQIVIAAKQTKPYPPTLDTATAASPERRAAAHR